MGRTRKSTTKEGTTYIDVSLINNLCYHDLRTKMGLIYYQDFGTSKTEEKWRILRRKGPVDGLNSEIIRESTQ